MSRFMMSSDHGYDRLVWLGDKATPGFWEAYWEEEDQSQSVAGVILERTLMELFQRHLPPGSTVLEAGCGKGQWVEALARNGHEPIGVDFTVQTLVGASKNYEGRSLFAGADVRALPFPDAAFDAVISLGVVEHFWPGPSRLMTEMARTIRPGGLLFLSVPYLNPLRRLKAALFPSLGRRAFSNEPPGFFQFGFGLEELSALLEECGVAVVESTPYSAVRGIREEVPVVERLSRRFSKPAAAEGGRAADSDIPGQKRNPLARAARSLLKSTFYAVATSGLSTRAAAHMMIVVGRRR